MLTVPGCHLAHEKRNMTVLHFLLLCIHLSALNVKLGWRRRSWRRFHFGSLSLVSGPFSLVQLNHLHKWRLLEKQKNRLRYRSSAGSCIEDWSCWSILLLWFLVSIWRYYCCSEYGAKKHMNTLIIKKHEVMDRLYTMHWHFPHTYTGWWWL